MCTKVQVYMHIYVRIYIVKCWASTYINIWHMQLYGYCTSLLFGYDLLRMFVVCLCSKVYVLLLNVYGAAYIRCNCSAFITIPCISRYTCISLCSAGFSPTINFCFRCSLFLIRFKFRCILLTSPCEMLLDIVIYWRNESIVTLFIEYYFLNNVKTAILIISRNVSIENKYAEI